MEFLQLKDISEVGMELINPSTPEKVVEAGRRAGLQPGMRLIEFGSGFGEVLALWAEHFGISGVGVEFRATACERARQKMAQRGLSSKIEIVCSDGAQYAFEPHAYDVAACVGATFIWGGFRQALQHLREAAKPGGRLVVGEAYWTSTNVPAHFVRQQPLDTEYELLTMAHEEGFDIEAIIRSTHEDWDNYETEDWRGLIAWLEANPDHPERDQVIQHLHESQEEYTRYGREYFGWAIYVLHPVQY